VFSVQSAIVLKATASGAIPYTWDLFCKVDLRRHNGTDVKEAQRQILRRRLDEPTLEVGAIVSLRDSESGIVLARYIPSGRANEVYYIVEVISNDEKRGRG
jgi:hypothetical protein